MQHCTCHPDDNPPIPCAKKFALSECRASAGRPSRLQAYFATRPRLRRIWIAVLGTTWLLCWPAVLLLGGCEHFRAKDYAAELNGLPPDLAEAQRELRSVGF